LHIWNKQNKKNKNSFILIELIIVTSLLILGATIWFCQISISPTIYLKLDLKQLAQFILYLQQKSISRGIKYTISFDEQKQEYYYLEKGKKHKKQLYKTNAFGFLPNSYSPSFPRHKNKIKNAILFQYEGKYEKQLTLTPSGKTSAGTIYIKTKKNNIMGAITIDPSYTKQIRKYIYINSVWEKI